MSRIAPWIEQQHRNILDVQHTQSNAVLDDGLSYVLAQELVVLKAGP